MIWPLRSVRARLTFWYVAVLVSIILTFSLGIYLFVRARLWQQLDRQLDKDVVILEKFLREEPEDIAEIDQHVPVTLFQVMEDGQVVYRTPGWSRVPWPEAVSHNGSSSSGSWIEQDGRPYHWRATTVHSGNRTFQAMVAEDGEFVRQSLQSLTVTLLVGLPCVLALAALGGYFLAGRVLSPITHMTAKAQEITAERLSERLPVDNPEDELGRLATVFNRTLARLQDSFEQLRRFTADASHELRTPLTALRSVGEVGLQNAHDPAAYRDVIGSMLEEADRLTRLVDSLLTLTRAESGRVPLLRAPVDLVALVNEVSDCLHVLAEEKDQTLSIDGREPVIASVDSAILRQALINVLDNAIKYTPVRGHIRMIVKRIAEGQAAVEFIDEGPGIPREHHDKIFDRFYRVEKERSRATGGVGLGLAIARWAVEINGGRIEVESEVGNGSVFRITLTCAPAKKDVMLLSNR